jgi:hypothetical protein
MWKNTLADQTATETTQEYRALPHTCALSSNRTHRARLSSNGGAQAGADAGESASRPYGLLGRL